MNRSKVITEPVTFKEYKKIKAGPITTKNKVEEKMDGVMTLDEIVKFSKDKKTIKSDKKRKAVTRELFIEYLDMKYNVDDY